MAQLRSLSDSPKPQLIRIGVRQKGCAGMTYHLEYVDDAGRFDEVVEQDGVKVLVDSKALFSIIGSEMEWIEDRMSARFVFRSTSLHSVRIFAVRAYNDLAQIPTSKTLAVAANPSIWLYDRDGADSDSYVLRSEHMHLL